MRPCLKSHPSTPTGECPHSARKCVAFQCESSLETVFMADEWDRTPTEPSKKLSYQELLELKEIQKSLPRANQPPDFLTGRAARHYLSGVPIALLPLMPMSDTAPQPSPAPAAPIPSPSTHTTRSWTPWKPPAPPAPSTHLPQPSHLPQGRQLPPRAKPRFSFVPLLDSSNPTQTTTPSRSRSPSPSRSGPPPTLSYNSLDSSPVSQASFQLPPGRGVKTTSYFPTFDADAFPRSLTSAMESMKPPSHAPTSFGRSNAAFKPHGAPATPPLPSKPKRNVLVINGIEIDMDEDEDEAPPTPKSKPKRNVIVINGIEIDVDDDDDTKPSSSPIAQPRPLSPSSMSSSSITSNGLPTPPPSTSPSPTLSHNVPLPPTEPESQFSGLHAPIRFKRSTPKPSPSPTSSPTRRGSFCGSQSGKPRLQNWPGPIAIPRA